MVEKALRNVVREALQQVCESGLPGDHHFYLTFSLSHAGVEVPDYLRAQHGDEMTIVLQYQFYDLEVDEAQMAVTLSFNNKHERLVVPLAAITTFADPSVNFALQFQSLPTQTAEDGTIDRPIAEHPAPDAAGDAAAQAAPSDDQDTDQDDDGAGDGAGDGNVVTLDQFRKKSSD